MTITAGMRVHWSKKSRTGKKLIWKRINGVVESVENNVAVVTVDGGSGRMYCHVSILTPIGQPGILMRLSARSARKWGLKRTPS